MLGASNENNKKVTKMVKHKILVTSLYSLFFTFCYFSNCAQQGGLRVNPLSPNSDQFQISPRNINALLSREVIGIKIMISQDEFL